MLLTVPLVGFTIATSDWLVILLLEKQWMQIIPLFILLGFSILLQSATDLAGCLFISQGQTNQILRWSVISALITTISFSSPWDAVGVAASAAPYLIVWTFMTLLLLFWLVVGRIGPIWMKDFYVRGRSIYHPSVSSDHSCFFLFSVLS